MSGLEIFLIILIVLVIAGAGTAFVMNQETTRRKRAMQVIKGQAAYSANVNEQDVQNKRRAEIAKKLKESKQDENKKKKTTLAMALAQAGLTITVKTFWIYSVVCMVALTLLAKLMGASTIVLLLVAVTGLLGVPRLVLKRLISRRQKKFLEEFPDALEAVVRLLKAGMPVSEAVSMIAREFEGPIGEEMSIIYDKQKIGVPLHEAALEATRRMPLTEMKMFATGLAIQAQTGSSLSEVLLNLAKVIRARFRLKRKVKALASEAVASASIIGCLPVLVTLGMWFANRDYIEILFIDPFGRVLLAGAVTWMSIGIFVMKTMINFKV